MYIHSYGTNTLADEVHVTKGGVVPLLLRETGRARLRPGFAHPQH